jgi:hypothetical protein
MLSIEEKIIIVSNRLKNLNGEITELFSISNSNIDEENANIAKESILLKMAARAALEQELGSLTEEPI